MKNNKKVLTVVHDSGFNKDYSNFLDKLDVEINLMTIEDLGINKTNTTMELAKKRITDKTFSKLVNNIDIALFTGGEDVDPSLYGEKKGKFTSINRERDEIERALYNALPNSTLKVGICRGAQFLTVMSGGRLIQHIEGHGGSHPITIYQKNSNEKFVDIFRINPQKFFTLEMTSTHHQMMFPYDMPRGSNEIIAWSKNYKSNTYLNGDNHEISLPEQFVEPEIVYYPNSNSLCIQGHPEFPSCSNTTKDFCIGLIEKYLI